MNAFELANEWCGQTHTLKNIQEHSYTILHTLLLLSSSPRFFLGHFNAVLQFSTLLLLFYSHFLYRKFTSNPAPSTTHLFTLVVLVLVYSSPISVEWFAPIFSCFHACCVRNKNKTTKQQNNKLNNDDADCKNV